MCVSAYLHRRRRSPYSRVAPKGSARLTKVGVPKARGELSRRANMGPHSNFVRMAQEPIPAIHGFAAYRFARGFAQS